MADNAQNNIKQEYNNAATGLNMDNVSSQIKKGTLTYALNAAIENFDANSINYQNELGNEYCLDFPEGYSLIGKHFIPEQDKHIFFLANPYNEGSEIGYMINNDCVYHTYINAPCLKFSIHHPIHKIVHRITNCSTEIYWTDGENPRRYLNLDPEKIPYVMDCSGSPCNPVYTGEVDCNQLKLQPNFDIPLLSIEEILSTGDLLAGTYQFAVQYADALSNPFTSYYSVTNPVPIADPSIVTMNFNYPVGKSIVLNISHLDTSGQFEYFNIAVIKTINAISSVELIGTYYIEGENTQIIYTGQNKTDIRLSMDDIFEKFPYYDVADDLTTAQDILIWKGLSTAERLNYQKIANQIHLQWETWRIPDTEDYSNEWNATNLRSYLRDEVYAFEIQFLLADGRETDGFHIPGRTKTLLETNAPDITDADDDFVGSGTSAPYWKIRNTAYVLGTHPGSSASDYKGPYQWGEFAYWESTEEYPCNELLWGKPSEGGLAGEKIRHHKFPDVAVSPIFESKAFTTLDGMVVGSNAVFPIGVKINKDDILALINSSDLSVDQQNEIVGFRILRGDRSNNKSIIAKGILRNVNKYTRDGKDYYFANYPYNDLHEDVFLNTENNAYANECSRFKIIVTELTPNPDGSGNFAQVRYIDCYTNKPKVIPYYTVGVQPGTLCSVGKPVSVYGEVIIEYANYDEYEVWTRTGALTLCGKWFCQYTDIDGTIREIEVNWPHAGRVTLQVAIGTKPICVRQCDGWGLSGCDNKVKIAFKRSVINDPNPCVDPEPLPAPDIYDRNKLIFNSPETSFGQPFLGDILKLESTIYGKGQAHFVEVLKNAKYKLLSKEAQIDALNDSVEIASITEEELNIEAMFASYQAHLQILLNGITRKNYAYSFNSIAGYNSNTSIPNGLGIKQRNIDKTAYLIPAVVSVDGDNINNWQRETSVYIRTAGNALPFPSVTETVDNSRFTISEKGNCGNPGEIEEIQVVSYYASMKKDFINQWGQIYTYNTISTGYERMFDKPSDCTTTTTTTLEQGNPIVETVFGGDTFICRFAFKTKLPFFIDNRVNAPDDSDIFYDEIGNVAYPKYWHSSRSILSNYQISELDDDVDISPGTLVNFISYKAHNFDCGNDPAEETGTGRTFYDGYYYLFAYGVPNFYCESSYNIDLRQAFNNREGDFWPHVGTSIPDDWVQESFVSIANDNTYYYNTTYSKQNKENFFSHLPADWDGDPCLTHYPFRAVYSDLQNNDADNRVNAWRIYRATSYYDFPQNFGDFTSIDGIQNSAILARFENKTLLYGNLLTIDTSNPQAAYIGNPTLFKGAPPVDFAETDLGYAGSQHKFLLKIPQGQISIDAKRGHVFLIQGTQAIDISGFGSGMNRFFTDHLPFQILNHFPEYDVDNHYNGVGLHGVYDAKFERVIITKIDYAPLVEGITYTDHKFYLDRREITLEDTDYFCNRSWTVSYNMNTKSWISFHSYIPNFYIGENNFFYSGLNGCCDEFDFIAQTTPITTTSSTTCSPVITTTSSTTREDTSCDIIGEVIEIDEDITTTTTSTVCIRPSGLINVDLITGYMNDGRPVGSTATEDLACGAMTFIMENPSTVTLTLSAYSDGSYIIGTVFYADNGTDDCFCIPNGWYFSTGSMEYCWIFHVVDCEIVEMVDCCLTTTTTTTAVPTTTTTTTCPDCVEYLIENIGNIEDPVLFNVTICNGASLVKEVYYDLDQISCCEPDSVVAQTPEDSRISMIGCCYISPTTTTSTSTAEVTTTTTTVAPTTTTTTTSEPTTTSTTTEEVTTTTTTSSEETTTTTTTDGGETTTTTTTVDELTTTTTTNEVSTTTTTTVEEPTTTTTTTVESTTTTTTEEITTTTTTTEETCLRNEYGFLYNYYAVVDERNIAPEGWRVPTEADFDILIASAGGEINGGLHLKSSDSDFWGVAGDNSTGFGAVGGGVRSGYNGSYIWRNAFGYYHSSDFIMNGGTPYNIILDLSSNTSHAYTTAISAMNYGLSVRLIKEDDVDEGYMCDNDTNRYPTVKIGNQVWMAQNLATTKYRNGESISGPLFTDVQWINVAGEAYCSYFDNGLCDAFDKCTTTTTTTLPCDLSIEIIDVDYNPTTTTTTTLCHVAAELIDIICEDITTTTSTSSTTTTTTSECECNSSMTVGSYIQGEYVSVGYGRDGIPPMDFSVMGSISPDCWNVVALCHNTYYTSKSILLILRNYPCCESIIVEINGVEYTLLFSLQNDIYCSYILSGVDNPFPEEGQICNIAICETSCTTTTTTVEPTTTTTTTTLLCEPMICDTTLTVGTDGDGNYGFLRGLTGSISPDCGSVNVVGYMDSQGLLGVVLIDYVCDVTLWINGVEYELTYFGYVPEYGGNAYFIPLVPNPFPSIGETCNVAICGTECTTTTTTEEPTTTTTTTTVEPYEYCVNFGLLYNGYVHQDGRQLTSSNDWIVSQNPQSNSDPDLDWDILFGYSGDGYPTGSTAELKDTNSDYWNSPNTGAMNSKKFNARGGGFRLGNGTFLDLKNYAVFGDGGYMYSWGGFTIMSYNSTTSAHWGGFGNQAGGSIRLVNRNTGLGEGEEGVYIGNDGKIYRTICINGIEWLADNLCETKFRDGSDIQEVTDNTAWSNLTTSALCAYNNDWNNVGYEGVCSTTTTTTTEELTTTTSTTQEVTTTSTTLEPTTTTTTTCDPSKCDYGLLYNWYALDTGKLAPTGWHVPTDAEWTTLTTWLTNNGYGYEGSGDDIAKSMASQCKWTTYSTPGTPGNDLASNNSSGFSGLPCGRRLGTGVFDSVGFYGGWWSSSEGSTTNAWGRSLTFSSTVVTQTNDRKDYGFSVRCVRDSTDGWTVGDHMTDIDGNQYDTIQLGTQIWTIQNLKTTHYNDGEAIPNITDNSTWDNLTTGALCAYNNDWETYACIPEPTTTTTTTVEPTTTTTTTTTGEVVLDMLSGYTGFGDTYDNGDPDIHGQAFCASGTLSEFSVYAYKNTADLNLRAKVYSSVPTHLGTTYPPDGYLGQSTNVIAVSTLSTDSENPSLITFNFSGITVDGDFFIAIMYEDVIYHHDGTLNFAYGVDYYLPHMIYIGDLSFWVEYAYGELACRIKLYGEFCTTTTTTLEPTTTTTTTV